MIAELCIVATIGVAKSSVIAPCDNLNCRAFYQRTMVEGYWRPIIALGAYEWLQIEADKMCLALVEWAR